MEKIRFETVFILVLLVGLLIFISGATGCSSDKKTTFDTTGLTMAFVDNAPPKQMVTGQAYPYYIDVQNLGGYDINPGNAHFYLKGVGDNLRNINTNVMNANYLNKKTIMQEGGRERIIFSSSAQPWKQLPSAFNFTTSIDSCYLYATTVLSRICVGYGDSGCVITGDKIDSASNSASPVQVTSITESTVGNKLYVTLTIQNKGTGAVYLPTTDCTKLIEKADVDEKSKINQVERGIRAEEGFICKLQSTQAPYGSIDSLTGKTSVGTVTCEKTLTETQGHDSAFEIALLFMYQESMSKSLTIYPA